MSGDGSRRKDSGPVGGSGRLTRLDAQAARRWAVATRSAFAAHRGEIDDLNVFPVPDGDTGTNLFITLDSALEAAAEEGEPGGQQPRSGPGVDGTMAGDAATLARTTLLAARGNSGVILSQLVRGLSEVMAEAAAGGVVSGQGTVDRDRPGGTDQPDGLDGPMLALAVRRASDRAYASVTRPVEGTILSVAAAAAGAAEKAAAEGGDLYDVAHVSLAAARVALAATTSQLPVLARAGVVDAGGLGYVLVLEALELVVAGGQEGSKTGNGTTGSGTTGSGTTEGGTTESGTTESGTTASGTTDSGTKGSGGQRRRAAGLSPAELRAAAHAGREMREELLEEYVGDPDESGSGRGEPGAPAYEVMYLLSDSDEDAVAALRARLDGLGDSVLVVGDNDLWNVHVHVDDVGAAIQAGIEAGRPHRIKVTHFGDQQRARTAQSAQLRSSAEGPVAVVACAAGEGLAEVFRAAGASPVFSGPGRRASAGQLLDAIRSCGSQCVVVLPNEADTQLAAEAAASAAADLGIEVHVVRSRSAVQGIAALAVFKPTATGPDNLAAMSGAAAATRHGAVLVAAKESLTSVGWCRRGDILGAVDGEVVVVGRDLAEVGTEVVARLLAGGGELLTVVSGAGSGPDLAAVVAGSASAGGRDVEVDIIDGGQATYPLLLGVE